MPDSPHVLIGKVAKAQGLAGELKLVPFSGDPDEFGCFQEIILARGTDLATYTVERCRSHGKFGIVKLREINARDDAEAQVGAEVLVLKSQLPPLSADEFYWLDMVGMRVVTEEGLELGEVTSLIATGAKDILVITGRDQEYLVPVLQEIIVRQDKEAGVLVIAPMAGLLEMNLPDAI